MVEEARRVGQARGAGFYDYDDKGRKSDNLGGLKGLFAPDGYVDMPFEDVKDRLLFPQVLEAIRIHGGGRPHHVWVTAISAPSWALASRPIPAASTSALMPTGCRPFAERAKELAEKYGEVFEPPALLLDMASGGRTFA